MHAHIIVSRKDRSNTKKLSPKTNHTGKKNCGNVKGGFDRTDFSGSVKTLLIGAWGLIESRRKVSTTLTPSRTAARRKSPGRWNVRSASERRNGTISKRSFNPGRSRRGQNTACGENAGHRAAHSQETAGGRSGTPAETQKSRGFGMGM